MGASSGLAAGNDCNLMQPGFMLFLVGFFILAPAEKEEDRERDDDAHAGDPASE